MTMTKQQKDVQAYQAMVTRLQTLPQRQALKQAVEDIGGDGWSILKPEFFLDKGIDAELVERLTYTHKSDGSPKGTIFNEQGQALLHLKGIHTLSFLDALGRVFGVSSSKMGRGFQARELSEGLLKVL